MKTFLAKAISFTFIISAFLSVAFVLLIKYITRPVYTDGELHRNLNCFPGLEYGIPIAFQLMLMLAGFVTFLNLIKNIRNNSTLSFLSFFFFQVLFLIWTTVELGKENDFYLFLVLYVIYFIPWVYFYIKFKKKFASGNV